MIFSEALFKLLEMQFSRIEVSGQSMIIIPVDAFSPEEIEDLRNVEEWRKETGQEPIFANFLPDDIRPAGVKKL